MLRSSPRQRTSGNLCDFSSLLHFISPGIGCHMEFREWGSVKVYFILYLHLINLIEVSLVNPLPWRKSRSRRSQGRLCYIQLIPAFREDMGKLRISIVEFLNTAPLVWGFTDGPLTGKYDLSFAVPSQCAEALKRGEVDVAIIPAIEYQRIENTVVLPGMAVAAEGEVRSLLVVSKKPIDRAKRIALDTSSRATVALVRMLAPGYWNINPEFVDAAPD